MKPILFSNGLIFNDGFRFIGTIVVSGGMIRRVDSGRIDLSMSISVTPGLPRRATLPPRAAPR